MDRLKRAFAWWRRQKIERPLVRGAAFWATFWSASAAAIVWVYAPGGIGDPDRDSRVRIPPKKAVACPAPCVGEPEAESVAASTQPVAPGTEPPREPVPEPSATPTPITSKLPIPLPDFKPPTIIMDVLDQFTLPTGRYVKYRVALTARSTLVDVKITTDVPARTWFVECSTQSGQLVCVDQYAGASEGHQLDKTRARVSSGETLELSFTVRLDTTVAEGEAIANHAHATWPGDALRSASRTVIASGLGL